MIFCYTHRSVPHPAIIRKVSSDSTWKQIHSQTLLRERERERERDLGALSLKWDVSIKSLHSELREPCRRGGRTSLRARGDGEHKENKEKERVHRD
jgi:hypothetical protein